MGSLFQLTFWALKTSCNSKIASLQYINSKWSEANSESSQWLTKLKETSKCSPNAPPAATFYSCQCCTCLAPLSPFPLWPSLARLPFYNSYPDDSEASLDSPALTKPVYSPNQSHQLVSYIAWTKAELHVIVKDFLSPKEDPVGFCTGIPSYGSDLWARIFWSLSTYPHISREGLAKKWILLGGGDEPNIFTCKGQTAMHEPLN